MWNALRHCKRDVAHDTVCYNKYNMYIVEHTEWMQWKRKGKKTFFISGFHFATYPVCYYSRLTNEIGCSSVFCCSVFIQSSMGMGASSHGVLLLFIITGLWLVLVVVAIILRICLVIIGIKQGWDEPMKIHSRSQSTSNFIFFSSVTLDVVFSSSFLLFEKLFTQFFANEKRFLSLCMRVQHQCDNWTKHD